VAKVPDNVTGHDATTNVYLHGSAAKDDATYCHGNADKDNAAYCHGSAADNNTV
jgi:hypothetical protein